MTKPHNVPFNTTRPYVVAVIDFHSGCILSEAINWGLGEKGIPVHLLNRVIAAGMNGGMLQGNRHPSIF